MALQFRGNSLILRVFAEQKQEFLRRMRDWICRVSVLNEGGYMPPEEKIYQVCAKDACECSKTIDISVSGVVIYKQMLSAMSYISEKA
jgi:hypothetical protein